MFMFHIFRIAELCRAHSCYLRCLFIDMCSLIMDTFSKALFKEYFFERLLSLSKDSVPNVRLKLCRLFPRYVYLKGPKVKRPL